VEAVVGCKIMDAKKNIAYIDAANLDKSLREQLGWEMDYGSFRIWLEDKYQVEKAYIFIGLIPKYQDLYTYLQSSGFTLAFKQVVYNGKKPKGNCDSDLIVQALDDLYEGVLANGIIVSSDGDYAPLVKKLQQKNAMGAILSPAKTKKCSVLLKRTGAPIAYINDQRSLLEKSSE